MTKSGKHCVKRRNCTFWKTLWQKGEIAHFEQQIYSRRLWKCLLKIWKISRNEGKTTEKKLKTLWQKERKRAISFFVTMFSKSRLLQMRQKASIWGKGLTLSNLWTHFDTSAADNFWKPCGKRWNCSKQAISHFATI